MAAATATRDVADPAPSPAGPRPFSRPTPANGGRSTPRDPPSPFVAPFDPERAASSPAATPTPAAAPASMRWPAAAELDGAHALEALARRLRVGSLRLPVAVDATYPPAILAAVLAALHAEATAGAGTGSTERSA